MKGQVSSLVSGLPEEGIDAGIKTIVNLLKEKIVDEKFIKGILDKIEANFNAYTSIEDMLKQAGIDYDSAIDKFIETRIEAVAGSSTFKAKLTEALSAMVDRFLDIEIKSMFNETESSIQSSVSMVARDLYNKFIENNAADVIEILDVAKIVEDKINEFDVDFAEQVILEISSKELKAITWLGALLGAIMGLLSPILNMLY
jgi:uncharacterized membrane protein YheB (UPF0754 family)